MIPFYDVKFGPAQTSPRDPPRLQTHPLESQPFQTVLKPLERAARIDHRPDEHVPGNARRHVQVGDALWLIRIHGDS